MCENCFQGSCVSSSCTCQLLSTGHGLRGSCREGSHPVESTSSAQQCEPSPEMLLLVESAFSLVIWDRKSDRVLACTNSFSQYRQTSGVPNSIKSPRRVSGIHTLEPSSAVLQVYQLMSTTEASLGFQHLKNYLFEKTERERFSSIGHFIFPSNCTTRVGLGWSSPIRPSRSAASLGKPSRLSHQHCLQGREAGVRKKIVAIFAYKHLYDFFVNMKI